MQSAATERPLVIARFESSAAKSQTPSMSAPTTKDIASLGRFTHIVSRLAFSTPMGNFCVVTEKLAKNSLFTTSGKMGTLRAVYAWAAAAAAPKFSLTCFN